MKKLIVQNVGPIKNVELILKRINVIIGPQSAGKSCLLKLACFCAWVEKRIQLEQGRNGFTDYDYWLSQLVAFHKLQGFFNDKSRIEYVTSEMQFSFDFGSRTFDLHWNHGHWKYERSRISYIPAERNIVAVIPNWFEVNMGMNNIRSFISDWNLSRKMCDNEEHLPILDLGVRYYYDKETGNDKVELANGERLDFANASSGLQSAIPMLVYLDFLFNKQYTSKVLSNINTDSENEEILGKLYEAKFRGKLQKLKGRTEQPYIGKIGYGKLFFASEADYKECKALYEAYTSTHRSDIYLEEPEQNLFPLTQIELVYELLKNMSVHNDSLFVATHSPYILYALNNCMLGYKASKNIPADDVDMRKHSQSWINPKEVSVWELRDGNLSSDIDQKYRTIQDEDGLVRGNYFDRIMKSVMTDFSNYSSYYE